MRKDSTKESPLSGPPRSSLLGLNEVALVGSHELCIRQICDEHLEVHSNVSSIF